MAISERKYFWEWNTFCYIDLFTHFINKRCAPAMSGCDSAHLRCSNLPQLGKLMEAGTCGRLGSVAPERRQSQTAKPVWDWLLHGKRASEDGIRHEDRTGAGQISNPSGSPDELSYSKHCPSGAVLFKIATIFSTTRGTKSDKPFLPLSPFTSLLFYYTWPAK